MKTLVISTIVLVVTAAGGYAAYWRPAPNTPKRYQSSDPTIAAEADRIRAYDDRVSAGGLEGSNRQSIIELGRTARQQVATWPDDSRFTKSRAAFVHRWELFAAVAEANTLAKPTESGSAERRRALELGLEWTRSAITQADAEYAAGIRSRSERDEVHRNVAKQIAALERAAA